MSFAPAPAGFLFPNLGEQPMPMRYGASPGEWKHFSEVLGLTDDILPVVCNPNIPISLDSTLKSIGKTPP